MPKTKADHSVPAQSPRKLTLVMLTLAATALSTQANAVNAVGGVGLEGSSRGVVSYVNAVGGVGLE
ncbi:hypothetical protein [Deinococcus cavernae]|uniref:hypothetical protein n=1 Tax=Deinococcus cavernae TaxID=2320857 RepID=UPI0011C22B9E|nr:hypothetical protein [Deinococcus cavernae]